MSHYTQVVLVVVAVVVAVVLEVVVVIIVVVVEVVVIVVVVVVVVIGGVHFLTAIFHTMGWLLLNNRYFTYILFEIQIHSLGGPILDYLYLCDIFSWLNVHSSIGVYLIQ